MTAASIADRMSPRTRSPEREATRLLGSPSLGLPSLHFEAEGRATWALNLFYEPHRAPLGVMFARAVSLEPGRYELTLEAGEATSGLPPDLIATNHRTGKSRRSAMNAAAAPRSLISTLIVDTAGEVDLSLIGGEPVSLVRAGLRRLPGE
jgi:hypothetical protein